MNEDQEKSQEVEKAEDLIENLVPGLSQEEYESIRQRAIEEGKTKRHAWVMKGRGKLVCTNCPFPHVSYVPMDKTLIGIDDKGQPVLKDS